MGTGWDRDGMGMGTGWDGMGTGQGQDGDGVGTAWGRVRMGMGMGQGQDGDGMGWNGETAGQDGRGWDGTGQGVNGVWIRCGRAGDGMGWDRTGCGTAAGRDTGQNRTWDGNRTEHGMGRWDRTGGLRSPAWCCPLLNTLASHNLEMKHLPGADPELVLLNHRYEELEVSGS